MAGYWALMVAALALAAPSLGHAATTTYSPTWTLGSSNQGVDSSDRYNLDPSTGRMTLARLGGAVNGSLGCAGIGPFANFEVAHSSTDVIRSVSVHFDQALIDPYTWLHVGLYKNGAFVDSFDPVGPLVGSGDLTIDLTPQGQPGNEAPPYINSITSPVSGPLTIEFGMKVASACPSVDGGTALFTSVTVITQ